MQASGGPFVDDIPFTTQLPALTYNHHQHLSFSLPAPNFLQTSMT